MTLLQYYGMLILTRLERNVTAAIYLSDRTLLQYCNLFDTNLKRCDPFETVPLFPPEPTIDKSNITSISLHSTEKKAATLFDENNDSQLEQEIMMFDSIIFTRSMVECFSN